MPMEEAIGPVTRAELDRLRSQYRTPTLQLDLTIGGETERLVHETEQNNRTLREEYIAHRLELLEGRAQEDFTCASLRGKAKQDFERSR